MEEVKKFLIDTDILIDFLRGVIKIHDFLLDLKNQESLVISVVNIVEIYSGKDIKDTTKRVAIEEFLSEFEIILLDENLSKEAGEIKLEAQISFADAIIAATALSYDLILVSRNTKHFSKVKGLKIETPYKFS